VFCEVLSVSLAAFGIVLLDAVVLIC